MWLVCSCCSISFCNWKGIIILVPFVAMPSIITNSFLIGQYCLMLCSTSSLLHGLPCIIYSFCSCSCAFSHIAYCMSSIGTHTGMFIEVLMALMFIVIPSVSWLSVWLLWESLSMMYMPGPGLYMMYTLYWCSHRIIQCNHWDCMVRSLLSIATNGLWSVMTHTSPMNSTDETFLACVGFREPHVQCCCSAAAL